MSSYALQTPPASLPIAEATAKLHCKIDHDCEDVLVRSWIGDAVASWESYTGHLLMTQAWAANLDWFPSEIRLSKAPVTAVTSVKYYDGANVLQTLAPATYEADIFSPLARVRPVYGSSWPSTFCRYNAAQVLFTAGYATADEIPGDIIDALMLYVGHRDRNRQEVVTGTIVAQLPMGFRAIADRHRVAWF